MVSGVTYRFDLNDKGGTSRGAKGYGEFQGIVNSQKVTVKLEMSCPLVGDNEAKGTVTPIEAPIIIGAKCKKDGHPVDGYFVING